MLGAAAGLGGAVALGVPLLFNPAKCRVITAVGAVDPATGKKAPTYVQEDAPWSAVRDAEHAYGFAAFEVDPGGTGPTTAIHVTYYAAPAPMAS